MKSLRAAAFMIATILGLGILGLPFVFAKAGFVAALIQLILVAAMLTSLYLMYAEITLEVRGKHRFGGYIGAMLGQGAGKMAGILIIITMVGGLLPFLIVTGSFLQGLVGINPLIGSLSAWVVGSLLIYAGTSFVSRIEIGIIATLLLTYVVLIIASSALFDFGSVVFFSPSVAEGWSIDPLLVPMGVFLFAFGGLGAIAEVHDLLGRQKRRIGLVILSAMLFLTVLYATFALAVVGAMGSNVTQNALADLSLLLPAGFGVMSLLVGLISALSIFVVIGTELKETIRVDYAVDNCLSWLITIFLPLVIYLAGARELTAVMGFFGSIFGATLAWFIIVAYKKTAEDRLLPLWICYPIGAFFFFALIVEVVLTIQRL